MTPETQPKPGSGSPFAVTDIQLSPEERMARVRAAEAAGEPVDVLAFYGHAETPDGSTGAGCLSQWYPLEFTVDGVAYPTAEHWMMAGKARLFADPQGLREVLAAPTPKAAKAAGRRVRNFVEERWVAQRYAIVVAGNLAKFGQHPDLRGYLLGTGERVLVEASPRDRIWGIGMGPNNPDVHRPSAWRGRNLLGFALMEVRERLGRT
jgi:ribA/ribD-fused uncharacterized protein